MAGAAAELVVRNRAELSKAFEQLRRETVKELRPALLVAAAPIRDEAQDLAVQNISNIGPTWSKMRLGATAKAIYVAPKQRRTKGNLRRPNLAGLLSQQMEQAANDKQEEVERAVSVVIDEAAARNGFL